MQSGTKNFVVGGVVGAVVLWLLLKKKKCPACPSCQQAPVTTLYPALVLPPAPAPAPPPPPPPPPAPEPAPQQFVGFTGWGHVK